MFKNMSVRQVMNGWIVVVEDSRVGDMYCSNPANTYVFQTVQQLQEALPTLLTIQEVKDATH